MDRHTISKDEKGRTFWSDSDGDEHDHQKVYREEYGSGSVKKVNGVHYDPDKDEFHKG